MVYFLFLAVAFFTRAILLMHSWQGVSAAPWTLLGTFLCGLGFDTAAAAAITLPLVMYLTFVPRRVFAHPLQRVFLALCFYLGLYLLLFAAISEWFFWDEFGARFNFIAVDYLVYTHEVIGNIRESYPIPAILSALLCANSALFFGLWKWGGLRMWMNNAARDASPFRSRIRWASGFMAVPVIFTAMLNNRMVPEFGNTFNQELAKNGLYSFAAEFRNNELNYDQFYDTVDTKLAFSRVRQLIVTSNAQFVSECASDITRRIENKNKEKRWNVIQITVESLSAKFLGAFGNTENLTPNLDALARDGLLFTHFYATGNRTVRGMEALTLSVPPTPGQSIVKRPHNEDLFTLGSVFRSRGYDTAFIYGGFGYFDNMNYFFGGNGYKVIDREVVPKTEVTFANVWGACDEDAFRWALQEADASFARGKPFHQFIMTTSNHRPFTYPEGKIDLPPKISGRRGGVKYTDYAIGKLMNEARGKPWFTNTIFVIVADHCAGSAGKTALPVEEYEIPLLIYNPSLIPSQRVEKVCSQIDLAPTILGLLNWSYTSRFFGEDIVKMPPSAERAFIANYQKLGYLRANGLEILEPVRKEHFYEYDSERGGLSARLSNTNMLADTVAYYQTASYLFRNGMMGATLY